jgi:hypothetical protein
MVLDNTSSSCPLQADRNSGASTMVYETPSQPQRVAQQQQQAQPDEPEKE